MIKKTIENIRRRIKEYKAYKENKAYREEMNKEYPISYLCWGVYDKQVNEGTLQYSYKHEDCFLVNDLVNPTGVIRLTGDSVQRDKVISITRFRNPIPRSMLFTEGDDILIARDNNHTYKIWIGDPNRFPIVSDVRRLEEIISHANFVNQNTRNRERQKVVDKSQVDFEFCK